LPYNVGTAFSRLVVLRMEVTASGIEVLAVEGAAAHEPLPRRRPDTRARRLRIRVERNAGGLDAVLLGRVPDG
jgi:hypothetical protein